MLEPMISLWMEHDLGYDAQTVGLCYLGNTVATLIFGPLSGYLGNCFGRWIVILVGVALTGLSFTVISASGGEIWNIVLGLVRSVLS